MSLKLSCHKKKLNFSPFGGQNLRQGSVILWATDEKKKFDAIKKVGRALT
jgi:hypothetical protein